jgi:hypothetical protein
MIKTIDYIKRNFSIIPISNDKKPLVRWKYYQKVRPTNEIIDKWYNQFGPECNIAIITGKLSELTVIDVDNPDYIDDIIELWPDLANTTIVKTKRGYHFYLKGVTSSYNTEKYEVKSEGSYVVAPESIINNHKYKFISSLDNIKNLPKEYKKDINDNNDKLNWVYSGKKYDCIGQILTRELLPGERDISLFILFNLLLKRNAYNYAMKIVSIKNNILKYPLGKSDLNKIFRKKYNYGCQGIRRNLRYIDCGYCEKFNIYMKKDNNIIIKNINKINQLNNSERGMLLALATIIDENYTINKISEVTKMNYQTVKKLIDDMKAKGIEL